MREVVRYAPDLVIVYSGHNEFAERRFYAHLLDTDPRVFRAWELLASTRLFQLVAGLRAAPPGGEERPTFDPRGMHEAWEMFAAVRDRAAGRARRSAREDPTPRRSTAGTSRPWRRARPARGRGSCS